MSRLHEVYNDELVPQLKERFGYHSVMEVPRITKITLNMGVGEAIADKKVLEKARDDMEKISGQKPVICRARKSVAAFKIRDGMPIGCKVTLRRERMYEFLDRLVNIAIPRIRDFRGLPANSWDGHGNYTFGLNEQTMFAEIDPDKADQQRGMDITIVTTAKDNESAKALLDGIQSIADNSFITFSWTDDGTGALTCTRIGSSTQSFYLPKIKSNL